MTLTVHAAGVGRHLRPGRQRLALAKHHGQKEQEQRFCCSWVVVRRRVELPTFRFSEGFAYPRGSTTGRLTGPSSALALLVVHDQPYVSTAVVSKALAGSAVARTVHVRWLGRADFSS